MLFVTGKHDVQILLGLNLLQVLPLYKVLHRTQQKIPEHQFAGTEISSITWDFYWTGLVV